MSCLFYLLLFSIVFQTIVSGANDCDENKKVVVCYFGSWAVYRNGTGKFTSANINATLCTHAVYTFAGLDIYSKISSLDNWNDIQQGGYNAFTALKEKNPCMKTLLALGGWNEGSMKYSVMASTQQSRTDFVESVLRFLVAFNFDGLDFDWEYPGQRGGIAEDKQNFASLIQLLRERLSKWNLKLTVAVPISKEITETSYDVEVISKNVDYVFLMAYDYTPVNSPITGLLAPLSSIKSSVDFWLSKGLPNNKLVLGVPTYARAYNLTDPNKHNIGDPVKGPALPGRYTQEAGFLSYYELQAKLLTKRYKVVPTNDSNYYAYGDGEWLSFDVKDTYTDKVKYAKGTGLAGIMVWSIDTDDFRGLYNSSYPVLSTINNELYK